MNDGCPTTTDLELLTKYIPINGCLASTGLLVRLLRKSGLSVSRVTSVDTALHCTSLFQIFVGRLCSCG